MNRAARRRQQKEYDRQIDRGIDIEHVDEGLIGALMRRTHEYVERAKRVGSVDALMQFVFTAMDKSSARLRDVPVACSKGCWYCCTVWVAAKAPESFYFAKTFPKNDLPGYSTRLGETMNTVRSLSFDDRGDLVTPCPALKDGLCSNYQHRPNVCRSASSADAGVCKRSYVELSREDIPTPYAHMMVRGIFATALEGALAQAGLAHGAYEFNSSVEMALQEPKLEKQWLSGEDVFAGLPLDPASTGDKAALD